MVKLRVFAKRPTPLEDTDIVEITNFDTEFHIDLYKQVDDQEPQFLYEQKFVPKAEPGPGPEPEPPVPVEGGIIWQSKGIWDNGKSRTLTQHHEYDPFDKLSEVAAGGHGSPRKWEIPGDGDYCKLGGGMSRVYVHTPHDGKIEWGCILVWNKSIDDGNLSLEYYSRHNEGGDVKGKPIGWKRFGGVTMSFHKDTVESKLEYFHKNYAGGKSKKLPQPFEDGKAYPLKVLGERILADDKQSAKYTLEGFVDYGNGMTSVGKFDQSATMQQAPSVALQPLYWRFRTNGSAPKAVELRRMYLKQL